MTAPRSAAELADVTDPAWPELRQMIDGAAVPVTVLPVEPAAGAETLYRLQVTAHSTLGGLALNCGGLLVDHGWLRILGAGTTDLPGLATANRLRADPTETGPIGALTIAYDILGGEFAINSGALPGEPREVCYFAPDTLRWEPIGGGHSAFVHWAITGGLDGFYRAQRWPGWHDETAALTPGQGISVFPPLWSAEGRDIAAASRRPITLTELLSLRNDMVRQLNTQSATD